MKDDALPDLGDLEQAVMHLIWAGDAKMLNQRQLDLLREKIEKIRKMR